ncbi:hypothetical protein Vretifemale_12764 [Volvox reticuliferus]|uniref:Uncharacterized protein n=1 Tax=Volvox reticuliferus TaxID=1737510 RepID=A0A8J4FTW5_9CHLO|nr:hypothetical protein Vretifemale_12764 [Volvox reticuliferus]
MERNVTRRECGGPRDPAARGRRGGADANMTRFSLEKHNQARHCAVVAESLRAVQRRTPLTPTSQLTRSKHLTCSGANCNPAGGMRAGGPAGSVDEEVSDGGGGCAAAGPAAVGTAAVTATAKPRGDFISRTPPAPRAAPGKV